MSLVVRGLRGAVTVESNSSEDILTATASLLERMIELNNVDTKDIVSVIFSMTADLNAVFPAEATRRLGWEHVPLFCCSEIQVPNALGKCIRILMHITTDKPQADLEPVYIGEAKVLLEGKVKEKMQTKPTIAIDGPAGAGKSTVAKAVAKRLKIDYLDTGAMYRAVTVVALRESWDLHNEQVLAHLIEKLTIEVNSSEIGETITIINGEDVTPLIRNAEINKHVSFIAKSPSIRKALVKLQRVLGKKGGIVMDGRDIGTRVLPDAPFKFFLTASLPERARRRYLETFPKNESLSVSEVEKEIARRDDIDKNRKVDPLRIPDDSCVIDTTSMSIDEVIEFIVKKTAGIGEDE